MLDERELFDQAMRRRPAALSQLLGGFYPLVHRLAHALTPSSRTADRVVRLMMIRSLDHVGDWTRADSARRWFWHHTVLTTRRVKLSNVDWRADPLITAAGVPDDVRYSAFICAIRALPVQQREAFVLHVGEQFDARSLGIAMDCSAQAAAAHLQGADTALRQVMGEDLPALMRRLAEAMSRLTPSAPMVISVVTQQIARHRRRRWSRKFANAAFILLLIAAAWAVWRMVEV